MSAVLFGSLTPHEIEWNLPLSEGLQYEAAWWMLYFDPLSKKGIECVRPSAERDTRNMLG